MPNTKVIAKKDLLPFFKVGDLAMIVPILHEEDWVAHEAIYGLFKDDKLIKHLRFNQINDMNRDYVKMIHDRVVIPKGSYKDSYIELEDGRSYPSSIVRRFEDYFDKI